MGVCGLTLWGRRDARAAAFGLPVARARCVLVRRREGGGLGWYLAERLVALLGSGSVRGSGL